MNPIVHVITRKRLNEFSATHPPARKPLDDWYKVTESAKWRDITDVRRVYPQADAVTVKSKKTVTVFNIGANKYRLIAAIHYNKKTVYVLRILTHAEYDRDAWKEQL